MQAYESGFLDASCRDNQGLVQAYGLWCWRLKVPMVWFERLTPRSRSGSLRIDLLTTHNILTASGQDALRILGAAVTPHDAAWDRIALRGLGRVAHAALRIVLQARHCRRNRIQLASMESRRAKQLTLVPRRSASA